jgi:cytochrome c biogenesis protein CcdA
MYMLHDHTASPCGMPMLHVYVSMLQNKNENGHSKKNEERHNVSNVEKWTSKL